MKIFSRMLSFLMFSAPVIGLFAGIVVSSDTPGGVQHVLTLLTGFPLWLSCYAAGLALIGTSLLYLSPTIAVWSDAGRDAASDEKLRWAIELPVSARSTKQAKSVKTKIRKAQAEAVNGRIEAWNRNGMRVQTAASFAALTAAFLAIAAAAHAG
jgi:hypothetical protein